MQTFYTTEETSNILRINIQTLRRKCRLGEIKFKKSGRKYLFSSEDIACFLNMEGCTDVD